MTTDLTHATVSRRPGTILVADDQSAVRHLVARQMEDMGHRTLEAPNGAEALRMLRGLRPDLMLLDIEMPEMNGFEVLEHVRSEEELRHIPIIVISAEDDLNKLAHCIELGADDYMVKPYNLTLLEARVNSSLEKKRLREEEIEYRRQIEEHKQCLEKRVREQVHEISSGHLAVIFALSKLAESRDPVTGQHLERIREYCRILVEKLREDTEYGRWIDDTFIENFTIASSLHDIGKVGIPDFILLKPAALNSAERRIMQHHTVLGAQTLREVDKRHPGNEFIKLGIRIAESHHEHWDGTGYPQGLREDEIPLVGRILALADNYDALTSRRCYKEPFTSHHSRDIIVSQREKFLDPVLVDAFLDVEDQFIGVRNQYADPPSDQAARLIP